jgi:long-chain acyl-CoA synthetase
MEKIWLKHYEPGVPPEIDPNEYNSLVHLLEESCRRFGSRPAYMNQGTAISYEELDQLSQAFAAFLQQLGLQRGARVAIMLPNLLQYPIALFAILRAGYLVVNTNPLYTADELIHQMNDSGAEAIIILSNFAFTLEKSLPKLPLLKHIIITDVGDVFPCIKRVIFNFVVKYIKKMVPSYFIPHAVSFRNALSRGRESTFSHVELTHNDTAFLQYTGGTTGVPKAAMLSHGNMVANVLQAYSWITPLGMNQTDTIITALPLYHIFSLTANCLTFLKEGAKNILITNPRDMTRFIKEIKNTQFTTITGVNTLYNAMLRHPDFSKIDFSKVKLALSGGMALSRSVAIKWQEATHTRILEAYGLTESSPAVTMNPMNLSEYNGSIGLPIPSTDVSVRDDEGNELPIGERGELCVKGPQVMSEYWQRPDETALVFWPDGFLRTGDIVMMDNNGYIYLVDRKKDMILVSGFNVYPNEVEQVISMMPGVLEVGVIGVNVDDSGERIKACIVKSDPSLTAEQVINYTREHLTAYKIPKIVEFYDDLPKSNVGKILRRALS